jgi:hypothetical protein
MPRNDGNTPKNPKKPQAKKNGTNPKNPMPKK